MKHTDHSLDIMRANLTNELRSESDLFGEKLEIEPVDALQLLSTFGMTGAFKATDIRYAGRNHSKDSLLLVVITADWYYQFKQDLDTPWTVCTLRLPLIMNKADYEQIGKHMSHVDPWPDGLCDLQMIYAMGTWHWTDLTGPTSELHQHHQVMLELWGDRLETVMDLSIIEPEGE